MNRRIKATLLTGTGALLAIGTALVVQLRGQHGVTNCSYLDPVAIDLLAFLAGAFLVVEGLYRITEDSDAPVGRQLSRILRVSFGCSIITLHILQFVHK